LESALLGADAVLNLLWILLRSIDPYIFEAFQELDMDVAIGVTFLGIELAFIALVLLAIVRTGFARLSSPIGIARDGFAPGKQVPSWSLPDLEGHLRLTPAVDHWQLLVFADRSLVAFPDLIAGMHHITRAVQGLEVLLLSNESREECAITAQGLDLQVPIVPVDPTFYDRYRVRVMPFAFFLDPGGIVRWVGLVNSEAELFHAWRMTRATIYEGVVK
jgi:hypothetical protein